MSADEASIYNASAFAYMQHEFTDNWSVYSDVTANVLKSFGRYAPVPDTSNIGNGGLGALSINSPNNPTNPASPLYDPAFGEQRELDWWHRFDALGNRDNFVDTRLDDMLVGFEGFIFDAVEVECGIRNTSNKVYDIGYNYLLRSTAQRLSKAASTTWRTRPGNRSGSPQCHERYHLPYFPLRPGRILRSFAFDLFETTWGAGTVGSGWRVHRAGLR